MKGEIINVRVKPGHHTLLAELSVIDQLKLILANWQNRDAQELDANKTFALSDMKDKAGFITILEKAFEKLGEHKSITIELDSKYLYYVQELTGPDSIYSKYYDFKVFKSELPVRVPHKFIVTISKKG